MNGVDWTLVNETYLNLQARKLRLSEELQEVDRKLAAFQLVIEESGAGTVANGLSAYATLDEAIIGLAEENGGLFDSDIHRPLLVKAGLLEGNMKALSDKTWRAINKTGRFVRGTRRGQWRLIVAD